MCSAGSVGAEVSPKGSSACCSTGCLAVPAAAALQRAGTNQPGGFWEELDQLSVQNLWIKQGLAVVCPADHVPGVWR